MRLILIIHLVLGATSTVAFAQSNLARPNVILMMADDMGLGDTSAYQDFTGNRDEDQVFTPSMERLARMGVRFTDAHTPSSRCSLTRYALLTGRYPWRNRLKHWVLFGSQGDPMIEADRPTIGTLFQNHGYRTGIVGKWHVGLRYRQSDGRAADAWDDADLRQPMFDTPLDHGFDFVRFTSRSHATSGPSSTAKNEKKRNGPNQSVGPGHVHGRTIVGATGNGKELVSHGEHAYVLRELGGRHLDSAIEFLTEHLGDEQTAQTPFMLYYPSNSNHGPHTPDDQLRGTKVAGASKNVAGNSMNTRSDYIYENDVVLGHLIDFLQDTDDPRLANKKLIDNTIVIFTSDNGAEIKAKTATGPFRSNKGSIYEGGHRVPFLVSWPAGGVGDGQESTGGRVDSTLIGLQDMYATFAEVLGSELPDLRDGQKGAEDSHSVLSAWQGQRMDHRPVFFNDHNEADDRAAAALRWDDPLIDGQTVSGQWKLFLDASLLRSGIANPVELFDLATDRRETQNLIESTEHRKLIRHLVDAALQHRTIGGHRYAALPLDGRIKLNWGAGASSEEGTPIVDLREQFRGTRRLSVKIDLTEQGATGLIASISASRSAGESPRGFNVNARGLGVDGGDFGQVDQGEAILIHFNEDILIESAAIVAGNGVCGGYYRVGDASPLAIYCVDADIDSEDQSGILSDIGLLKAGKVLRLDSSPHLGVETPGRWRLRNLAIRRLREQD